MAVGPKDSGLFLLTTISLQLTAQPYTLTKIDSAFQKARVLQSALSFCTNLKIDLKGLQQAKDIHTLPPFFFPIQTEKSIFELSAANTISLSNSLFMTADMTVLANGNGAVSSRQFLEFFAKGDTSYSNEKSNFT